VAHRLGPHALPPATKDYVARRISEGKTKTETLRCLKRYIAREGCPAAGLSIGSYLPIVVACVGG